MKTINGQALKQMLISGGNNLFNHYPEVDALNVFPVPDGDTGMNMNLTMTSGAKEIQNRGDGDVYEIAKAFSRGLLMGARGNSGVITSQIFRGFAQGLEGKEEINAVGLSDAFQKGVEVAYKAVIRPVEGTILTVIRESSQYLHDNVKDNMTIEKAMELLIQEALDELCLGRTCIVVAHRLSTIKTASRIAVIEKGEIQELGTHLELMEIENGIYRKLYSLQFREDA
jgi:dihydroxyacetone kinase-like predicted kinase